MHKVVKGWREANQTNMASEAVFGSQIHLASVVLVAMKKN